MKDRPKIDDLLKQALEKYVDATPGDRDYDNGNFIKGWSDWLLLATCTTVTQKIVALSGYTEGDSVQDAVEKVTEALEKLGANLDESVCEDIALFGTGAIAGYTYKRNGRGEKLWEQLDNPEEIDSDIALNIAESMNRCIRMGIIMDIRMKNVSKDLPFVELPEIAKNLILHNTKCRINGQVVGQTATALEEAVISGIIGG
jgi:hypothetical protein